MTTYRRPPLRLPVFHDANGAVIDYGNRWADASPPGDSYSVDTHPERFSPLHEVADALIDHLRATYDVAVDDDTRHAAEFRFPPQRITRITRLAPSDPDAAPLTFAFTDYPGVLLHAGLLQDFAFPSCGCDACDETAESQAEELEWSALTVVEGGFREYCHGGLAPRFGMSLESADGQRSQSGDTQPHGVSRAELARARARLKSLPEGWRPWPAR